MTIYRTHLLMQNTPEMIELAKRNGGVGNPTYEHNDFWNDFDDAYTYVSGVSNNEKCLRAEMWKLETQENHSLFQENECVYEYDANGNYFWDVKEVSA